jgi:hypothetical protein
MCDNNSQPMLDALLLNPGQLPRTEYHNGRDSQDLGAQSHALLVQQKLTWEMLRGNYAGRDQVLTRSIDFDGFRILLQFNPTRITSSAAKVDEDSIKQRRCFLCPGNLPSIQRALAFNGSYIVLANPFPIFPEHFTIPTREHVPQRLASAFPAMLDLARAMESRYFVFYNGPRCGASAPDHLHFQAGNRNVMPIDKEFDLVIARFGQTISASGHLNICAVDEQYLRSFISLQSSDAEQIQRAFDAFYSAMVKVAPAADEPMINVLASYQDGDWRVILFPRVKHRPAVFFAEGDARMVLSPASVDFGGLCVTPVEKDFERLTAQDIRQMFAEVSLVGAGFAELKRELMAKLG